MSDIKKTTTEVGTAASVVQVALRSGLVNPKITLEEMVTKLDPIAAVAGYVAAWDRYVLVVAKNAQLTPEITFADRQ